MNTETATTGIRIGRSATVHMMSKLGGPVCSAQANNPTQRKTVVEAPVTCKACEKRADSIGRRGYAV